MKTCFWRDAIEADVISGKQRVTSVVATRLWPVELVGRAVLCPPREVLIIGAWK
jgi:hypothetical protein